jgi:hypothetical protein
MIGRLFLVLNECEVLSIQIDQMGVALKSIDKDHFTAPCPHLEQITSFVVLLKLHMLNSKNDRAEFILLTVIYNTH